MALYQYYTSKLADHTAMDMGVSGSLILVHNIIVTYHDSVLVYAESLCSHTDVFEIPPIPVLPDDYLMSHVVSWELFFRVTYRLVNQVSLFHIWAVIKTAIISLFLYDSVYRLVTSRYISMTLC